MKNRSLKAGGRLNRWSLKAGFTVLEEESYSILVGCGSPLNRPSDVKISVFVLQRPDVIRQGGAVPVASVSHRVLVAITRPVGSLNIRAVSPA